ncbi:MAG: hypothetical protein ACM3XZ_05225 [Betaproteobacteria bacterium]
MSEQHDRLAKRLANAEGVPYNPGPGPDIQTPDKVIEVEVSQEMLSQGIRQLQGFTRPRYLAVPEGLVETAKKRIENTKIGLINATTGKIVKRAQKPKERR